MKGHCTRCNTFRTDLHLGGWCYDCLESKVGVFRLPDGEMHINVPSSFEGNRVEREIDWNDVHCLFHELSGLLQDK